MRPLPALSTLFPYTTLFRSMLDGKKTVLISILRAGNGILDGMLQILPSARVGHIGLYRDPVTKKAVEYFFKVPETMGDRKSTRLNSSHLVISYAVFCLKKKR